jgi:DNA repair exonuclease SbcCD ATPase subunit
LFLSCFNPEYFNGVLDDKERRALITKYTPIVDMYALFEEFAPTSLISKYSININKASESARFNKFLKSIQDESIQPARTEIGVLNQQVMQLNIPTRKPVDQDKEKQLNDAIMSLNAVKLSAASIAEKQDKYAKAILDIEAKKKELDEFSEKVKQIQLPIDPKTNDPKYSQCIEAISASNQIIKLAQSISQANVGICSLCGQSISDSYKNELQNRANEAVVTKKQNEEYVNSQSEQYAKYLDSWNKIQEHLKKLGNELIMLEKMAESHKSDMNGQTTSDLSDVDEKIAKLSAELSEVAAKNQEAIMHNLGVDNAETQIKNNKKRIEELNKHIQDSLVSLEEVEKICAALKPSTGIFRKAIEIKSQDLLTHLNHCSILLERQLKNGDTEECFEIYYNERPYRRSSYSERVLCNLEIAKFLRAKSQKNIPLFLDNSESISNVPKEYLTCDQIFMCRVIAGQELIVRNS